MSSRLSDETKAILSQKAIERYKDKTNNPMYGKKHSEASRQKMREASRHLSGKYNPNYGKSLSDDTRKRMSESVKKAISQNRDAFAILYKQHGDRLREQKPASKAVMCVTDGRRWSSATDAANDVGVTISTMSGHLKGRQRTCKGLVFKYV